MLKTSELLQFLSQKNPQLNPARLMFYNFLKHHQSISPSLDPEQLNDFFAWSLDFPHWFQNRNLLAKEVRGLLDQFAREAGQHIDIREIHFPENFQVFEVDHFEDLTSVVQNYLDQEKDVLRTRLVNDQNKRLIVIQLFEDKSVKVRSFDKKFILRKGQLQPLRTFLSLSYNSKLELMENVLQTLEVAPYVTAQFIVKQGVSVGSLLRGYMFQRFVELREDPVSTQPKLFFPLKRIEQFFIDRNTDPYYNETVSLMERACEAVKKSEGQALSLAQMALNSGEMALENVFIGDKLLTLLIKDLKNSMSIPESSSSPKQEISSTHTWLKLDPITKSDLIN